MISLPPELCASILSHIGNAEDLRAVTNSCRSMRSWSYLYWERLELQGDIHALIRKLQALDDFLGHSPDAADSQWSIVQTFTIRDRTPHNTTMMWHAFYENEGPVERLDVLLAQVIVRAPNIHTLVVELGGYSVESGPWRTATAICGLRALRVLSLAHFHSIAFLENAPFVPFHNVPRKLTDVVLQDCYGLDLHGLLENQSALRTVDLDTIGIASNIVESWNNVGSISIYLEDFIDDWIPVNDDDWIQAICRPLVSCLLALLVNVHFPRCATPFSFHYHTAKRWPTQPSRPLACKTHAHESRNLRHALTCARARPSRIASAHAPKHRQQSVRWIRAPCTGGYLHAAPAPDIVLPRSCRAIPAQPRQPHSQLCLAW